MSRRNTLRLLILGLLLCWCGLFLRQDNTEKSIVRAIVLEQAEHSWSVALLYQFPDAAADSSEAQAVVRIGAEEGETLREALLAAEQTLPEEASYRLCDHILLVSGWEGAVLTEFIPLVLEYPDLRMACRVAAIDVPCKELVFAAEHDEALPGQLLQQLKTCASDAPRLYAKAGERGLLLPLVSLGEDDVLYTGESVLLTQSSTRRLLAQETAVARLLAESRREQCLLVDTTPLAIRRSVCGVEVEPQRFVIRLSLQLKSGQAVPSEEQLAQLECLCEQTLRQFWEAGADWLSLRAFDALRNGSSTLTTKNACPEIRADVTLLG